jgi:hypothetical protein
MRNWIPALLLCAIAGCGQPTMSPPPPTPVSPEGADTPSVIPATEPPAAPGSPSTPTLEADRLIAPGDLPPESQPPKEVRPLNEDKAASELQNEAANPVDKAGRVKPDAARQ